MRSKIGAFPTRTYSGQIQDVISSKMRVYKSFDLGQLRELYRALGAVTVFIARPHSAGDDFIRFAGGLGLADPERAAEEWWRYAFTEFADAQKFGQEIVDQNRAFYYEGFNEPVFDDDLSLMEKYGRFEAHRQYLMHEEGFKACIGNFPTGGPAISEFDGDPDRVDLWPGMYPALEAADRYRSVLGLHEYGGLYTSLYYGDENQHNAVVARGGCTFPETYEEGWLICRYRKVWRRHIVPNGWTGIRIAITEFGLDRAGTVTTDILTGGANAGPFKQLGEHWRNLNGRNDSEQFYLEQLRWADAQMQRDSYLIGATMFAWGTESPVWEEWNIEGNVGTMILDDLRRTPFPASARVVTPLTGLYLRTYPTQESAPKAVLATSEFVEVLSETDGWAHVMCNGLMGFAMAKWLAVP